MTNNTRTFLEGVFSAVASDNFGDSFSSALSDNVTWTVMGSSLIAGSYPSKSAYLSQVLTPLRAVLQTLPVPIVERIIVDGEWASIIWKSEGAKAKNGADYDMRYSWIMRVASEGGQQKIVEVYTFHDSQKVSNAFQGYDIAALRGGK